jgi:2,4-dienoyl-CoA reductase-like NADH-dependent reductase (Old Yellow Enzyme family)
MHLFSPLSIRSITLRNRIAVAPMCQYSCVDGLPTHWHLVHLGSRAVGGAALVMAEATAVEARGRISPGDTGLWSEAHTEAFKPIAAFIKEQGAVPAIQLAHAGRKASASAPWINHGAQLSKSEGGWDTIAPSAIPFYEKDRAPHEMTVDEIKGIVELFGQAAKRSLEAGFEIVELHGAHGYLMNEFLSPLTNHRTDEYGGPFENRLRFLKEVTAAVRSEWPDHLPLFLRISASDWAEGGWNADDSVHLAKTVKDWGIDLVDCSSGAVVPHAKIPAAPGFQVPFADRVKNEGGILSGAVGLITEPHQANEIITSGQADLVLMAREFLRDPYWPLHAAKALGVTVKLPVQYERAF